MRQWIHTAVAVSVVACAGGETDADRPPADGGAAATPETVAADELATSLIARVEGSAVHFSLNVTNASGEPVSLDFNSGQRFDVSVSDAAGASVWTWSADKSFIQALGTESIEPGETLTYEATWAEPAAGAYSARGVITATNRNIAQEVEVQVPNDGGS